MSRKKQDTLNLGATLKTEALFLVYGLEHFVNLGLSDALHNASGHQEVKAVNTDDGVHH